MLGNVQIADSALRRTSSGDSSFPIMRLVFSPRSHVHGSASHRGRMQGATTKSYQGDTSRRSNAAGGHEGRRDMRMISETEHLGELRGEAPLARAQGRPILSRAA